MDDHKQLLQPSKHTGFKSSINFKNNPEILNVPELFTFTGPFVFNASDSPKIIPFINSLTIYPLNNNLYFNISQAQPQIGTQNVTITSFRNHSYMVSFCTTLLFIKQIYPLSNNILAYAIYPKLTLDSSNTLNTISAATSHMFGISPSFGTTLQPKCAITLSSFLIDLTIPSWLSFDTSQSPITSSASANYLTDLNTICLASITCNSSSQYYPLLQDCDTTCTINNCQQCTSSTSCKICKPKYYIDGLLRCSPCIFNCLSCNDSTSCTICNPGYYYDSHICQLCSLYCLNCTISYCISCAPGYIPNGTRCLSCQVPMPRCLLCTAPIICSLCADGYAFNARLPGCASCDSMMPNCQLCNQPNNCLACAPNYYPYSFWQCFPCTHTISFCCNIYLPHCANCSSNTSCSICNQGWFTLNNTCSPCNGTYGKNCLFCNQSFCLTCTQSYFLNNNNSCTPCNHSLPFCLECSSQKQCTLCASPALLAQNQCILCPIWPTNQLYYLDNNNTCQPCSNIANNCLTCNQINCLSCIDPFYLQQGNCTSCSTNIPLCISCKSSTHCSLCQNGYYVNPSTPHICQSCSLPSCLSCFFQNNGSLCSTCASLHFPDQGICKPCSLFLDNCLQCANSATCILCQQNHFLNAVQKCTLCNQVVKGCQICKTNSQCTLCQTGYLLQGPYCSPCSRVLSNCAECSSSLICTLCLDGYFLSLNSTCVPCNIQHPFCLSCSMNLCSVCYSGYYINATGSCTECHNLIPNCYYCNQHRICLSCLTNYYLNNNTNSCQSCPELILGCSNCIQNNKNNYTQTICQICQSNHLLSPDSLSCIPCSTALPLCLQCLSPTLCNQCGNSSFLNQNGGCSLCSLYLPNCLLCNNSSACIQCSKGYTLDNSSNCINCNLQTFGITKNGTSICLECFFNTSILCSSCTQGYYMSQNTQCILCITHIPFCKSCTSPSQCTECQSSYYLNSIQCTACPLPNCDTCNSKQCLTCLPSYFLSKQNCIPCIQQYPSCSICDTNKCLQCLPGYYLNTGICQPCSAVTPNCLLCNSTNCIIIGTPPNPLNSTLFTILGIVALSVLSLALIVWLLICFRRKLISKQQEAESDTSRRMTQYANSDIQIQKQKTHQCQYCNHNRSQIIKIQLLCKVCQQVPNRGHCHKIKQIIHNTLSDHIIEHSLSQPECHSGRNTLIQSQYKFPKININTIQKQKPIGQPHQPDKKGNLFIKQPSRDIFTRKTGSTKIANTQKSNQMRHLF